MYCPPWIQKRPFLAIIKPPENEKILDKEIFVKDE